jgi:hypothetical protein
LRIPRSAIRQNARRLYEAVLLRRALAVTRELEFVADHERRQADFSDAGALPEC